MPNDLQDQLVQAREQLRRKQKLDSMLRQSLDILKEEQQKCRHHEEVLAAEQADVEKLEGVSLATLFYSVLGTKHDRMKKEQQEYLAAKLKHEQCTQAVEDARHEVKRLQGELLDYQTAQAEYDRLLEQKQHVLKTSGDQRTATLAELTGRLTDLEVDRREIREAVEAGIRAKDSLEAVRSKLQSAANWGTWDLLGGGTLVTMAKHSQIDAAKKEAHIAQRELRRFREELADADQRLHISLDEIGGFSTFADYLFDGLIADWVVQSKVRKASEACNSSIGKVDTVLAECRRRLSETEQEAEQLTVERREFIEQA